MAESPPATAQRPGQVLAFRCGSRAFSLGEIVAATARLDAAATVAPGSAGEAEIEAALEAFRYQRDLVSAEECERWLAARGLTYSDLVDSLTRQLAVNDASVEPLPEAALVDQILAPDFPLRARSLARRVALAHEQDVSLPDAPNAWGRVLAEVEHEARAGQASPTQRARRLAARRLELSRVVVESAEFDEAEAAREACCCLNLDRLDFPQLAEASGCSTDHWRGFFGDLPALWQQALSGREIGQAVALALEDGRHLVLGLRRRALPSLADDEVCRRLDDEALEELGAELERRHVRWLIEP